MALKFMLDKDYPNPIDKVLGITIERRAPPRADQALCSFCGSPVSFVEMTEGSGPMRFKREIERTSVDPLVIQEVIKVRSAKLIACPECAGNIEPTMRTYPGTNYAPTVSKNNIKFRSEE